MEETESDTLTTQPPSAPAGGPDTASNMPQIFAICTIVGALFLIVAAFLSWIDIEALGETADSYTGMDMYSEDYGDYDSVAKYAGIVGLVLGIVVVILAALNFIGKLSQITMYTDIVNALVAVVALVFVILVLTWNIFEDITIGGTVISEVAVGTGVYIALVGAILSIVGSVIPFVLRMMKKA